MTLTKKTASKIGTTLALMLILACAGATPANPGDSTPVRAPTSEPIEHRESVAAPIEDVQINVAESFPVQYFVAITIGLPNACYDFGEAIVERDGATVRIAVTNLAPADSAQACAEIYRTIVENVALGSDFDPDIAYTLVVNGESYQLTYGNSGSVQQPSTPDMTDVPAPIESAQINITNRQTGEATLTIVSGLPNGCAKLAQFDVNQRGDVIAVIVMNSVPSGGNIACASIYGTVNNQAKLRSVYTACETYPVEINGEIQKMQAIDPAVRCRAPQPSPIASDREQVPAPIENIQILATKSLPPQYTAVITVGLPNACYDSGESEVTRNGTVVFISVTNLAPADPNAMCAEIYRMVVIHVNLGSDFEPGVEFTVDVNGKTAPLNIVVSLPSSNTGAAKYGSPFGISQGSNVNVGSEEMEVTLESINDSRCPANVTCIWMGQAVIVVSAAIQGEMLGTTEIILESQQSTPSTASLGDFVITFVSIDPYPGTAGQTKAAQVATLIVQPKKQSGMSGNVGNQATAQLRVETVSGSPLTVRLIADIVGGADDDQNLYCQGVTWSLGDGNRIAMMPGCVMFTKGSTFSRHWEETYTYDKPGTYEVSFTYGPLAPATAQLTVN